MSCFQCGHGEIDSDGLCLKCGYKAVSEAPVQKSEPEEESLIESADTDTAENILAMSEVPSEDDLPQWRKDLSRRIQEVKQKKERINSRDAVASMPAPKASEDSGTAALRAELLERMKARKPSPKPPTPAPLQITLQPIAPPAFQGQSVSASSNPQNIQNLIDTAVSRKTHASENAEKAADPLVFMPENEESDSDPTKDTEGKLILLSRTLSGLVDLVLVVLFTGIFIVTADHFWGIRVVDLTSIIHFSLLFLLIYFVYSIFFLASSNQTIGMMITELRVVSAEEQRPLLRQIVGRNCCFLIALLGLGVGLLWGLFSRENLCLHDRVSGTYIIRI
jgi:uncharacterized RDD family membrane protein YckC